MIHITTTILLVIALAMAVLALVGVGILIHNIIKLPDSYYRVGGTDNGDDAETINKNEEKI